MTAEIIDGKAIAESLRNRLAEKIAGWQVKPYLAVILVGSDPASIIYDRNKQKAAQALGMACDIYHLPEETAEADLLELIGRLNNERKVNGILVQMPLPKHINAAKVIETIAHEKDVDGFGPYNAGLLHENDPRAMVAATLFAGAFRRRLKRKTCGDYRPFQHRRPAAGVAFAEPSLHGDDSAQQNRQSAGADPAGGHCRCRLRLPENGERRLDQRGGGGNRRRH